MTVNKAEADKRCRAILAALRREGGDFDGAARALRLTPHALRGRIVDLRIVDDVARVSIHAQRVAAVRRACAVALEKIDEPEVARQVRGGGYPALATLTAIRKRARDRKHPAWVQASELLAALAAVLRPDARELVDRVRLPPHCNGPECATGPRWVCQCSCPMCETALEEQAEGERGPGVARLLCVPLLLLQLLQLGTLTACGARSSLPEDAAAWAGDAPGQGVGAGDQPVDPGHDDPCGKGLKGPWMVPMILPTGGSFCADSTEVTRWQYAAFLAARYPLSEQPLHCAWNDSYVPWYWQEQTRDDLPAVSMDWCDARAYCAWAGKRLCGRVGGGTVSLQLVCSRLGITLLHAKPYDAPARGKMERFWRRMREQALSHIGSVASLADVEDKLRA